MHAVHLTVPSEPFRHRCTRASGFAISGYGPILKAVSQPSTPIVDICQLKRSTTRPSSFPKSALLRDRSKPPNFLFSLARKAARGEYTSPEGKSPYQLLDDWLDVVERFSDDVGPDIDETVTSSNEYSRIEAETADAAKIVPKLVSVSGPLIRLAGPPTMVAPDGKPTQPYDEDEDPSSPRKLNIERIIQKDGLDVCKDQSG
jgi:hypothetical protein